HRDATARPCNVCHHCIFSATVFSSSNVPAGMHRWRYKLQLTRHLQFQLSDGCVALVGNTHGKRLERRRLHFSWFYYYMRSSYATQHHRNCARYYRAEHCFLYHHHSPYFLKTECAAISRRLLLPTII